MVKKYLPLIILLLIAVPVLLFYIFFRDVSSKDQRILSFEAVPENAIILLENQSAADLLQSLNSARRIKEDLILVDELKAVISGLEQLDSIFLDRSAMAGKFKNLPVYLSIHQTGDDQHDYFIVLRSGGKVGLADLEHIINDLAGSKGKSSQRTYSRTKISSLSFGEDSSRIAYSEIRDYILISPSEILIEGAIRQIKNGISLQDNEDFNKVSLSAGQNVHGNVYVNLSRFPGFAERALANASRNNISQPYGTWLELDLTLRPDAILLNGFASPGDTTAWLDILENQEPQKIELDQVIPANCLSFFALGFSDPEQYLKDLDSYLASTDSYRQRQSDINKLMSRTGEEVIFKFMKFVTREAGLAYLPGADSGLEAALIVGTQSRNMAMETLNGWIAEIAGKEGKQIQDYQYSYQIDAERKHTIYKMPVQKIPQLVFGPMFSELNGAYFGFADNYLIIADSRQAIQDVIYFNELNKTLSTDLTFQSTVESIVTRSNFYFYSAPFRSSSLYTLKLNKYWDNWVSKNQEFSILVIINLVDI